MIELNNMLKEDIEGLSGVLKGAPRIVVKTNDSNFSLEDYDKSVDNIVVPGQGISLLRKILRQNLSEEEALEIISWEESDFDKRIRKIIEETKCSLKLMDSNQVLDLLKDSENIQFVKEVSKEDNSVEFVFVTAKYSFPILNYVKKVYEYPNTKIDIEEHIKENIALASRNKSFIEQQLLKEKACIFQHLSKDEKRLYQEFLKTPAAKKYNKTLRDFYLKYIEETYMGVLMDFHNRVQGLHPAEE